MLIEEGNMEGAKELYWLGRNVRVDDELFSLRDFADYSDFKGVINDKERARIYVMYETFYDSDNYAAELTEDGFELEDLYYKDLKAKYYVPSLMKALIVPQYAMRSFFAACDICSRDKRKAQKYWDTAAATLVGSIASQESLDIGNNEGETRGASWYALNEEYCRHFNCGSDNDINDPMPNRKMMEYIQSGFQAITRSDCNVLIHLVREMESILLVPILQGMLYHTAQREKTQDEYHYGAAYAFSTAIVPILYIRSEQDAMMISDALREDGQFTKASQVWAASLTSLPDLGIDCEDVGEDTMGILSATRTSLCSHFEDLTFSPSVSPTTHHPAMPPSTPRPTQITSSPTTWSDNPDMVIKSELIPEGYTFMNERNVTMK